MGFSIHGINTYARGFNAAHRCLGILGVIVGILAAVDTRDNNDESLPRDSQVTYASMARVCRGFYEPSMNALYACMNDFTPLISSFPSQWLELQRRPSVRIFRIIIQVSETAYSREG